MPELTEKQKEFLQNPYVGVLTTLRADTTCSGETICVLIGGRPAAISYAGLAPGLPGVYQVNAEVPVSGTSGNLPIAIVTPTAVHDQAYVPVR